MRTFIAIKVVSLISYWKSAKFVTWTVVVVVEGVVVLVVAEAVVLIGKQIGAERGKKIVSVI